MTTTKIIFSPATDVAKNTIRTALTSKKYRWAIGSVNPAQLKGLSKAYARPIRWSRSDGIILWTDVLENNGGRSEDGIKCRHLVGPVSGRACGTGLTSTSTFLLMKPPLLRLMLHSEHYLIVVIFVNGNADFRSRSSRVERTDFGILLPRSWIFVLLANGMNLPNLPNLSRMKRFVLGTLWIRLKKSSWIILPKEENESLPLARHQMSNTPLSPSDL